MKPAAVLFDLDGVLIDSYHVWFELMNGVANDFGYPPISADAFHASWGQSVEADRETFFPRHTVDELAAYYDDHFADHLEHLTIADGVPELFETLRARGLRTAMVTNTPQPLAADLVARAGATPDAIVGGTDVPNPKPAPDMVIRACELLGVEPTDAVMVGDSHFDKRAAEGAGVRFIGLGIDGDVRIETLDELLAVVD